MKPNPSKHAVQNPAEEVPPSLAERRQELEAEQNRLAKLEEAELQRQQKFQGLLKEKQTRADQLQGLANSATALELWIYENGEALIDAFTGRDSEGHVAAISARIADLEIAKRLLPTLIARRQAELAELDKQIAAFSKPPAA